jgi:hypothetical protein
MRLFAHWEAQVRLAFLRLISIRLLVTPCNPPPMQLSNALERPLRLPLVRTAFASRFNGLESGSESLHRGHVWRQNRRRQEAIREGVRPHRRSPQGRLNTPEHACMRPSRPHTVLF